jgi:tRNA threonylcarbamoyladenosine biosynthesis protein TsaE
VTSPRPAGHGLPGIEGLPEGAGLPEGDGLPEGAGLPESGGLPGGAGLPAGNGRERPAAPRTGGGVDEAVTVATAGQMRTLGAQLAGQLRAGDLVVLTGPLGAGKTTLTQGIGAGLGIRGPVTSPTFVIARVHPSLIAGPDLVHADAYRLGGRAEVDDLDLDADLATSVTVVEWGEGLVEDLAPSFLAVSISTAEPAGGAADDGAGGGSAADDREARDPAAETDVRRTVHVRGSGERWSDPEAAQAISRALASLR